MLKLMIVDDSNIMRNKIARCESSRMFEVVFKAKNGQEAISACAQLRPDVVTMDLTMPGMGGLEAIRQLKAQEPAANILVISALGQKHAVFEALQLGAKNYIVKPINEENLQSVVRLLLSETTKEAAHG